MKARTRLGGIGPPAGSAILVQQGLRLMAETVNGTKDLLVSVDEEEEYDNLIELEDEIDD